MNADWYPRYRALDLDIYKMIIYFYIVFPLAVPLLVVNVAFNKASCCCCSEGATSLNSLMDTPHQTKIVELLITHVEVSKSI